MPTIVRECANCFTDYDANEGSATECEECAEVTERVASGEVPTFDRWDIVEAWRLCLQEWSSWIVSPSVEYYRLGKIDSYYKPGMGGGSFASLSENGKLIYARLNAKYRTRTYKPNWPMPRAA